MLSETSNRDPRSGFTLLEALVSFAILVITAVSIYTLVTRSLRSQLDNIKDLEYATFARAVLEEYIVTFPEVDKQGAYKEKWVWEIVENPIPHVAPSQYDQYFEYVQIEVRVSTPLQSDTFELTTVVARRAPGL